MCIVIIARTGQGIVDIMLSFFFFHFTFHSLSLHLLMSVFLAHFFFTLPSAFGNSFRRMKHGRTISKYNWELTMPDVRRNENETGSSKTGLCLVLSLSLSLLRALSTSTQFWFSTFINLFAPHKHSWLFHSFSAIINNFPVDVTESKSRVASIRACMWFESRCLLPADFRGPITA